MSAVDEPARGGGHDGTARTGRDHARRAATSTTTTRVLPRVRADRDDTGHVRHAPTAAISCASSSARTGSWSSTWRRRRPRRRRPHPRRRRRSTASTSPSTTTAASRWSSRSSASAPRSPSRGSITPEPYQSPPMNSPGQHRPRRRPGAGDLRRRARHARASSATCCTARPTSRPACGSSSTCSASSSATPVARHHRLPALLGRPPQRRADHLAGPVLPPLVVAGERRRRDRQGRAQPAGRRPDRNVWGLGRHFLGSNLFWYFRDPAGNFAEYYADLDQIPRGRRVGCPRLGARQVAVRVGPADAQGLRRTTRHRRDRGRAARRLMKIARFTEGGRTRLGIVDGDRRHRRRHGRPVAARPTSAPLLADGALGTRRPHRRDRRRASRCRRCALEAPIAQPPTFLAIGLNYADHVDRVGHGQARRCRSCSTSRSRASPARSTRIEVPTVAPDVGRLRGRARRRHRHALPQRVSVDDAPRVVAGYLIVNDVSVRDWQRATPTMTMGKSWDTHGPIGPWLVTADEIADPHDLRIRTWVDDDLRQDASAPS